MDKMGGMRSQKRNFAERKIRKAKKHSEETSSNCDSYGECLKIDMVHTQKKKDPECKSGYK